MLKTAIDIESGKVLMLETSGGNSGGSVPDGALDNMATHISALETAQATLQNDLGDLGDQVQAMQGDVNAAKENKVKYAGVWSSSAQVKAGEVYVRMWSGVNRYYLALKDNIETAPTVSDENWLEGNYRDLAIGTALEGEHFILTGFEDYNKKTGTVYYPYNFSQEAYLPTINYETGEIDPKGGIKGYYSATEIDEKLSQLSTSSGSAGSTVNNNGVRADYALKYGITDCPNGIISFNSTDKELTIHQGVVLSMPNKENKVIFGNDMTYEVEETGNIVLFYTQTESESGTIQQGFLEAGTVHYGENEPSDGVTSFLAWWQPSKGKWQFKSTYTGNVWREADAQPIANIKASTSIITSVNYIGYRIIDDDIFAQLEDIENLQTQVQSILTRLDALENV